MSWTNVKLIFTREVRDQLRDRRTLFMVAVLPLLLYPALGIGMVQMVLLFQEQPRTVVILGAASLPEEPALLHEGRFASDWFKLPADAEKLRVITEGDSESPNPRVRRALANAEAIRGIIEKSKPLIEEFDRLEKLVEKHEREGRHDSDTEESRRRLEQLMPDRSRISSRMSKLFTAGDINVLLIVPDDFDVHLTTVRRLAAERDDASVLVENKPRFVAVQNSADERSLIAASRVKDALSTWEDEILERQLREANLPASLTKPVDPYRVDLAQDAQLSASVWSKLFPALLVIMAVTGAFYPAIDLGAGEKERGTMETLLICPAKRGEIVMGKFFTIMLFSMATAMLNLLSMGLTGKYMTAVTGGIRTTAKLATLQPPTLPAMVWVVILLVPLAALFSALCLSLATFARSSKEGQYYLTPLLMVTMGLTLFCLSPGIEITPFYSVVPVVNVALLLKQVLANPLSASSFGYAIPVLITSIGYSLLALWWAIDQFSREEVLFREAERFDIRLWVRHLLRDKEPVPNFAEASFCFVLIMLLQFGAMKLLQGVVGSADAAQQGEQMLKLLMIQQLALIASPALFMGVMLTTSVVRTFRLRLPSWRMLALGLALPLVLHPLTLELSVALQKWFFPQLPAHFTRQIQAMTDFNQPLWIVLLAFAVAPAICEELAFRGFILSGYNRTGRSALAIALSSVTFGVMHMIPHQVFNAALLGIVLGLLAIRSRSLLPCIAFHGIYNALAVLHGRVGEADASWIEGPVRWFIASQEGDLRYQWPMLVVCGLLAFVLLRWLVKRPDDRAAVAPEITPPTLPRDGRPLQPAMAEQSSGIS
jgi:sodium transport system permease protein